MTRRPVLVLVVLFLISGTGGDAAVRVASQPSDPASGGFWTQIPLDGVEMTLADVRAMRDSEAVNKGAADRVYQINEDVFASAMRTAPRRPLIAALIEGAPPVVSLPLPDGRYMYFKVTETPVLPPDLAEKVPEIRTYSGVGRDDPRASASIEKTDAGWSAMIRSEEGTFFISPVLQRNRSLYVSIPKERVAAAPFRCFVTSSNRPAGKREAAKRATVSSFGGKTRIYRLAMAADGEYTKFFRQADDTDEQAKRRALAEIAKIVSRLNQVYSAELGIQFALINRELDIIFTDPKTDGYTNNSDSALLDENQRKLDTIIKPENYDLGHVLTTAGGGLAEVGAACGTGKARGETGTSRPDDASFAIDFVAHEIGHQLGANHTFNGTIADCGGGNRHPETAYEPGSGSTIMAYAGICGSQDVLPHSESYFHTASLSEIVDYISDSSTGQGGSCGTTALNGNRPPVLGALKPVHVPIRSPFALVASATDPDGDPLHFTWEQFDLGDPSPPDDDQTGLRPLFRSRLSTTSVRQIPSNPASPSFEALPAHPRTIHFRVTARDGRGGFSFADDVINAVGTAPFVITAPDAATTWKAGRQQTVQWTVAGTDSAPVNCPSMRISVAENGGAFTPVVNSTSNSGSATVLAPAAAPTAVVRLDCSNGNFFAVSPPFKIAP